MFQAGQVVAYGATGVCKVESITNMSMSRSGVGKQDYYVLRPLASPSCVTYVPVANERLTARMRPVLTKAEIEAMMNAIHGESLQWIGDPRQRSEQFGAILAQGLTPDLLKLIGCMYLEKRACTDRGKRFSMADERLLQAAERVVGEEFSYALQINARDVSAYIAAHLKED